MKKIIIITLFLSIFTTVLLFVKIDKNNQIKYLSLTDDISKYDENTCFDDGMSYYEENDITVTGIDIEKKIFFYVFTVDYVEGNLCAGEFLLKESYIENFINNAEVKYNENSIDIASLIDGKTPIISNKRYVGNNYENFIEYILDGEEEILYVFYQEDLLIIQVGYSDEGPKFIAYK